MWPWSSTEKKLRRQREKAEKQTKKQLEQLLLVDNRALWDNELLEASERGDEVAVRALLQTGKVHVNARNEFGYTPLHWASSGGHDEIVKLLLNANADPNKVDAVGRTPLHKASANGHVEVAHLLLKAPANPNASTKRGETPLHMASSQGHVQVVELLLQFGADLTATDNDGNTALHCACLEHEPDTTRLLITKGADIHAKTKAELEPLHLCFWKRLFYEATTYTLVTLQVLVSFGLTWDTMCDKLVNSGQACDEAPAFRICMLVWAIEHIAGSPLSNVTIEAVKRGAIATQAFIDALRRSGKTTFRRKLCVIGPSRWGKTSLIKSLLSGEPSLDHPDDRTIGIDLFPMTFDDNTDEYCITFWDYAGHEEYQPAHAMFFSKRTVYIICVDVHSSSLAMAQADFRADSDAEYEDPMDEFVSFKILRWIRLVFACQPDAEFVLIGTKADAVRHNASRFAEMKADLSTRLEAYAASYEDEVDREINVVCDREPENNQEDKILERLYRLKKYASNMAPRQWLMISCKEKQRVVAGRNDLQRLLVETKAKSFEMPEEYSNVLDLLHEMQNASAHKRSRARVLATFVSYDDLAATLKERIPTLASCQEILRILHDLGDVLWYENLHIDRFQNTVIVDPLLLIDFVRQIFDHNYRGETMPHKTLIRQPFWVDIAPDATLVLSLKRVLQHFHLVYPSWREMEWNSDLIVPAYWRTNMASYHQVVGLPLQLNTGEIDRRVCWEYDFMSETPDVVYDHFVVATYSSVDKRVVGPYGLVYEQVESNPLACRIVIQREGRFTVFRVEAIAGEKANWGPFNNIIKSMETILSKFPGLLVTRNAISKDDLCRLEKALVDTLNCSKRVEWMPPDLAWCCSIPAFQLS